MESDDCVCGNEAKIHLSLPGTASAAASVSGLRFSFSCNSYSSFSFRFTFGFGFRIRFCFSPQNGGAAFVSVSANLRLCSPAHLCAKCVYVLPKVAQGSHAHKQSHPSVSPVSDTHGMRSQATPYTSHFLYFLFPIFLAFL